MKLSRSTRAILSTTAACAFLFSGSAAADFRVTAFGDSAEFSALISGDVESAAQRLSKRNLQGLDFVQANNLCVTRILTREFTGAIAACEAALIKVESDFSVSLSAEKSAKASIYSNLAVARAQSGDLIGATRDLEAALSLNAFDRNAVANYSQLNEFGVNAEVAQSL